MFAVWKGISLSDVHDLPQTFDKRGYHEVTPKLVALLETKVMKRGDMQIVHLIKKMLDADPKQRPNAKAAWSRLTTFTTDTQVGDQTFFCGPCCMPLFQKDPLLNEALSESDPYRSDYSMWKAVKPGSLYLEHDVNFTLRHHSNHYVNFSWVRNLRHEDSSLIDVVRDSTEHPLMRKRIWHTYEIGTEGSAARREARNASNLDHRHILRFKGTYAQGNVLAILYSPIADFSLRTYLGLVELKQKPLRTIREAFGCLASALSCMHRRLISHGDIRPENILVVNDGLVYLSAFHDTIQHDKTTGDRVRHRISW